MKWIDDVAGEGWSEELPRAVGALPGIGGEIKEDPEDFRVDEELVYDPPGEGAHLMVRIRKRERNTLDVVRALAELAGVDRREVGFAGMKDRNAVTSQWFSMPTEDDAFLSHLDEDGVEVLEVSRNPKKLKPGHSRGNRFGIRVREPAAAGGLESILASCLERVEARGFPNYFGPQRFGRHNNVAEGLDVLRGERRARGRLKRILVSAVQSAAFNLVCGARWQAGVEETVFAGDIVRSTRSSRTFAAAEASDVEGMLARGEVALTAALPGPRAIAMDDTGRMERGAAALVGVSPDGRPVFEGGEWPAFGLEVPRREGLVSMRAAGRLARGARRPIVVRPAGLRYDVEDGEKSVLFEFGLPSGSYATVLLREFTGPPMHG